MTGPPRALDLRRIVVVGESCSGKSTLARALAARLGHPHVELDTLFWEPVWQPRGAAFRADAAAAAAGDCWVVDGNYRAVRELVWPRATLFVWLDRSLPLVLARAARRCVVRAWTGAPVCNGNHETWALSFFSRESLLLWILRTHGRRRREYGALAAAPGGAPWVVLRSNAEAARFLQGVPVSGRRGPSPG